MNTLFVPLLQPTLKHTTILKRFGELQYGDSLFIINNQDPGTLYNEMKAEIGETFQWTKLENGPDFWKVEIKKIIADAGDESAIKKFK